MPPTCFGPGIMTYTLSKAKVCRGWCAHGRQRSSSSISSVPILQFATLQSCYLTTCNLAMVLSCNLQLSKNFCLATYNLAKFLSCNLQLRNIHTLELATQQCFYLPTNNLAKSFRLTSDLAMFLYPILQLTTQECPNL